MSHSREVAALASKYLTRVHDGESLEDLAGEPRSRVVRWRTRVGHLGESDADTARAVARMRALHVCTAGRRRSALEEDDADLSQRLYAVLRAVIASRGFRLEDIVPIAEALREAPGPSAETHDAALAAAALPRRSLPRHPPLPNASRIARERPSRSRRMRRTRSRTRATRQTRYRSQRI